MGAQWVGCLRGGLGVHAGLTFSTRPGAFCPRAATGAPEPPAQMPWFSPHDPARLGERPEAASHASDVQASNADHVQGQGQARKTMLGLGLDLPVILVRLAGRDPRIPVCARRLCPPAVSLIRHAPTVGHQPPGRTEPTCAAAPDPRNALAGQEGRRRRWSSPALKVSHRPHTDLTPISHRCAVTVRRAITAPDHRDPPGCRLSWLSWVSRHRLWWWALTPGVSSGPRGRGPAGLRRRHRGAARAVAWGCGGRRRHVRGRLDGRDEGGRR